MKLEPVMLSQLAQAASDVLREHGDMQVFIDHFSEDEHVYAVVEVRREKEIGKNVLSFVVADYVEDMPELKLVK